MRSRRASRARAIPRRLKLERASRHRRCCCCLLFNAIILDAQFFFVCRRSTEITQPIFTNNNKATLFHSRALIWRQKKGGDFYASFPFLKNEQDKTNPLLFPKKGGTRAMDKKCSLSLCVVIKSSLRPPLAFFSPFFSSAHQEQQHSSCVVSDTFWTGSARRRPLFLSLLGFPFSLARAQKARRTYARAL